jgi:hypothetical protein
MGNLTLFEEEVLAILRQIEYCCETASPKEIREAEEDGYFGFYYKDNKSLILKSLSNYSHNKIRKYLRDNGINFNSFDVDDASGEVFQKGGVEGKSIQEIKGRVNKLIKKLTGEKNNIDSTRTFYFNIRNGELSLYPKEKNKACTFIVNKGRYKILVTLIDEKETDEDSYVSTIQLAKKTGYKSSSKCREGIHAIRKQVKDTFKNKIKDEFIEVRQSEGYRIGKKINISFEGTP